MLRKTLSMLIALPTTVVLLLLMSFLTQAKDSQPAITDVIDIDPIIVREDTEVGTKPRPKPPKPEEVKQPPSNSMPVDPIDPIEPVVPTDIPDNVNDGPVMPKPPKSFEGTNKGVGTGQDNDAVPILMLEPQFTRDQLIEGESGYVRACFDVTAKGKAVNIRIIESEPGKTFVKNAKTALYKWKFKPAYKDNIAVAQTNLCYTMEFELEN